MIEYRYQLYVGEKIIVEYDKIELKKEAKILHLRNAVFEVNKNVLTHTVRGQLAVYKPGTPSPPQTDPLDEDTIQQFINDNENKAIADELRSGTWIVVAPQPTGTGKGASTQEGPNKKPATILGVVKSKGCFDMSKDDLVELSKQTVPRGAKTFHIEPDRHIPFVARDLETRELHDVLTSLLETKNINDRHKKLVCEYATISGAGKTRWIFQAFNNQFKSSVIGDLPVYVVHINFNASDRGFDAYLAQGEEVRPDQAACRLLLSRGLLECSPDLDWLQPGGSFKNFMLPNIHDVISAIFERRFGTDGAGLVIVHLDELSMLKDNRIALDSSGAKKQAKQQKANAWIKSFVYAFAALTKSTEQRFVVPIITHTNPVGYIMGSRKISMARHVQLKLYPFSLEQSWELLNNARLHPLLNCEQGRLKAAPLPQEPLKPFTERQMELWSPCVRLAGGHPYLLLQCYDPLYETRNAGFQATTVGRIVNILQEHDRVGLPTTVTKDIAKAFVYDALTKHPVTASKYDVILDVGCAWYLPTGGQDEAGSDEEEGDDVGDKADGDEEEGNEYAAMGTVSTPFPNLLNFMKRAGGMYEAVATNINSLEAKYRPTKAMEYVAALAISHRMLGRVDHWREDIKVGTGKAVQKIATTDKEFLCVWPSEIEPATDFGGKLMERDKQTGTSFPVAHIGQVKMQEPGVESYQGRAEVMDLAWFIGESVRRGKLTSRVHAYFVSSRMAPRGDQLDELCHAFRVVMAGLSRAEEKKRAAMHYGIKEDKVNVSHFIGFFRSRTPSERFQFTYIGRSGRGDEASESLVEMKNLLPPGIFAGWY